MTELAPALLAPLLEALDNSGIGLVITRDGPGGLTRVHDNRTVQRILGRTTEELRAIPVMSVLAPEERVRLQAMREDMARGVPAPPSFETVALHPDGTRVPIELGVATHVADGHTFALVFMRDLSERRAMQARLLEADRLSTVGALCAGLAHEINNPLTYVLLHLGGLRRSLEKWIPEAAARGHVDGVLDTVMSGCDRVSAAVRELLVFADPALGKHGPVELRAVVEGAVRAAAPMVEIRATLRTDLQDVAAVDGDPPRLGQAVLNLIVDAGQAFDDDDRARNVVEVKLYDEDRWVVVEVIDNGRAPDPHGVANAFEPFFRVRGATSTGIGLAVTRTIVAALGGATSLEPRPDGGAVSTIRLPRRRV